jgi:hypothetical protein
MVQKGKKVQKVQKVQDYRRQYDRQKIFFLDLQLGNMHSLRDVHCRKLLIKKKLFLGPSFFCTFLPFCTIFSTSVKFYEFLKFDFTFLAIFDRNCRVTGSSSFVESRRELIQRAAVQSCDLKNYF